MGISNGADRFLASFICYALIVGCTAQLALTPDASKDLSELSAHYLPPGYAQPNVTFAELQRLLEQKCQRANAVPPPGASREVNATKLSGDIQMAAGRLFQCVSGLVNISVVLDEIERARPTGDLDVVFEKYCLRMPQARDCLLDFNNALLPCFGQEEREQNALMLRIMNKLLDFICYKNGDQIALFIAEEGPECLEQHKDHVGSCLQSTFGHYLPNQLNISQAQLPDIILGPRQCVDVYEFERCVVRHLETCSNITPSNIVESMFRFVRKESKCQTSIDNALRAHGEALSLRSVAEATWSSSTALLVSLTVGSTWLISI